MRKRKGCAAVVLFYGLLALALVGRAISNPSTTAESGSDISPPQDASAPRVTLRAASGATILFMTQNGRTVGDVSPQTLYLSHLVLHRNGTLTDPDERTLIVEVSGIEVPPGGVTVALKVETQHGDPDLGGDTSQRIVVWRESQQIANTSGSIQMGAAAVFGHEFGETVTSDTETVATPTDYFRYEVAVTDAGHPIANPLATFSAERAFLMEDQSVARLPAVQEVSEGAAPDELVVYACDMFPFQKNWDDPTTLSPLASGQGAWLPREDVRDYVQTALVPLMVEAFRVQTDDWGFAWHEAWTSFRAGEDEERLSVALSDGQTWFHGSAPIRGHAGISIGVAASDNAWYDTLIDGLMSSFYHELFHNLQRNIHQASGGDGDVGGREGVWEFLTEGTAVLASSVGQPLVEFSQTSQPRAYVSSASRFLGQGWQPGDLNTSYERMNPYNAAVYWRFLYEQCGGMRDGVEDPAAGMQVIEQALTVLYSGEVVDIASSTDLVRALPTIGDRALAGSSCPYRTYEESLIGFARAIYALRLDGGRCTTPGIPAGCGFYDPHGLYHDPLASKLIYSGADQPYAGEIGSSFGIDFVEVALDPAADGQALMLEFYGAAGADAEFNVELWRLIDRGEGRRPQLFPGQLVPEVLMRTNADGRLFYDVPAVDTAAYNRLGLIITRVDAQESSDPVGAYTIVLHADAGGS